MPRRRRQFQRQLGQRRYRRLFIVAVEGAKTEPEYFSLLNSGNAVVKVECIPGVHANSPPHVLERIKRRIARTGLRKSDEAWLVVDKDSWADAQLLPLFQWSQESEKHGFALSNPNFEYWLLLHFEDANIKSANDCSTRLERYIPGYDKGIDSKRFSSERISQAIARARKKDTPLCTDWPRSFGTTVYRLVERIVVASNEE